MSDNYRHEGITFAEYIQRDLADDRPNEYAYGTMIRRGGRTANHNRISASILYLIGRQRRGRDVYVFSSKQRVYVSETETYRFPDLGVTLGRLELDDTHQVYSIRIF